MTDPGLVICTSCTLLIALLMTLFFKYNMKELQLKHDKDMLELQLKIEKNLKDDES